jgi:hypothetical protein
MKAKSFEKPTLVQAVGIALLIEATAATVGIFLWKLVAAVTL